MMELWILPELERRELPLTEIHLRAAQIIFFPNGRRPEIRINDEIRALASVKLKAGISKDKGELIYENEVEGIDVIGLSEKDDVDCAHITLVRLLDTWFIAFDFRYNKAFSERHIQTAKEFYESAQFSYEKKNWSAFVDSLFSTAELTAKAILLSMPDPRFRKKASHRAIQLRLNRFASLGNIPLEFRYVFNKLSGWRDLARYPKVDRRLEISEEDALNLLETVKMMIEGCEKQLRAS